jgi:hypothetical protein
MEIHKLVQKLFRDTATYERIDTWTLRHGEYVRLIPYKIQQKYYVHAYELSRFM